MPIREESFRIGCGRYLQKPDLLLNCKEEILRLGTKPMILGGETALKVALPQMEKSIKELESYRIIPYKGSCNEPKAKEFADQALQEGFDVVVGVGGGVMMDFAKLVGDFAKLPVINVPTSSATCAAYTPLSVRYTPEGRTVGSKHYGYEVSAVLADSRILSQQPTRLFLAGVLDSLAKFVEIKQRAAENGGAFPLGLDWAYCMAEKSFHELTEKTETCLADMACGVISETVEQVLFICLAGTGVISGIARGSNQTALGHKFYEATRELFFTESRNFLHGEIVGIGLILQNDFNGERENNDFMLRLMKHYKLPSRLREIGLTADEETKTAYYERLKKGSAIDENDPAQLERLQNSLNYLWEMDRYE